MAARLDMSTPLRITKSKPTKTIMKERKPIKARVEAIVPELPSQLLQDTQPDYTVEQWERERADIAENNYKRMVVHREEIIENVEQLLEQYHYYKNNLVRLAGLLKQSNEELVYYKSTTSKLRKEKRRLEDKIKFEMQPTPEPKKKNPGWVERPIIIHLSDGEEGEEADRELEREMYMNEQRKTIKPIN